MDAMGASDGLFTRIARVMGQLNNIPKTGTNTFFNYKFVTMEAVSEAVRKLLAEQEVAFFASIVKRELVEMTKTKTKTGEIEKFMRWVVDFEFTFAHGSETHVCLWSAEADATDDKGINKCASAAEKYFLLKTFIISTGNEPDADADQPKQRREVDKPRQPTPQPQQRPLTPPSQQRPTPASPPAPTVPTVQASGASNEPDKFAEAFAPSTGFEAFLCDQVLVQYQKDSQRHMYIAYAGKTRIATYGGDVYRAAVGNETVEAWKTNPLPNKLKARLKVMARMVNDKWEIQSAEGGLMKTFRFKVSGVTYEGRQALIAQLTGDEPVRAVAEPTNPYDKNAIAIHIAHGGQVFHVGYVPKDKAAVYAPLLDGENIDGRIRDITGGFEKYDGSMASYGLIVEFELPEAESAS